MKTPEDIENEYNKARKELDTFDKEWEPLVLRCRALFAEMKKNKVYHGIFHSMSELEKYKGKELSSIRLVMKDKNDNLSLMSLYNDDSFFVNDQGYLEYSSSNSGYMEYDEDARKYVFMKHFNWTEYDFVGFVNISVIDE